MKHMVLACVASVASVFAGQALSQSAELDDVGKAIMGHEAFMQRCADDGLAVSVAELTEAGEIPSDKFKELYASQQRELCDTAYDGINVCMEGGASKAIEHMSTFNETIAKKMRDPLTRADDYKTYLNIKEFNDREIVALQELMAGESSHCDMANQ